MSTDQGKYKITVFRDGPYIVEGGIPLVRKTQVVTEHGEPVTWKKDRALNPGESYALCRCGHSREKPFCDGSHCDPPFDGTEQAETSLIAERQVVLASGKTITVRRDVTLCMESGFCGTRFGDIESLAEHLNETDALSLIIAMIERCPSGSYTYSVGESAGANEPDLPAQIAITTEMTAKGPIMGPLWVTGSIPIERADGQPLEPRNRVTLCRCGLSGIKPLCDGEHRRQGVKEK